MRPQPFDCRSGFDKRVVWALRMVGVNLKEHLWSSGRRKDHCVRFTFHGDKEFTKGVLIDFVNDEFDGTNIRFYANPQDRTDCYVLFDERRLERYVEDETHASQS